MRFYIHEGGVGDVIALTATIREYHKARPAEEIYVSTGRRHDDIFYNNPHLAGSPKGGAAVVLEMEKYNDVGNLAVSFGIQAGIQVTDHTPELWLSPEERAACPIGFDRRKVIVIDPWARCQSRRWTWERWDEVVRELRKRYLVVVSGKRVPDHVSLGTEDRPLSGELDFTNQLSLREQAAMLERADLYLGMDSGGTHLAAAVGCPQVVLYSRSAWYSRSYWNTTPVYNQKHPCTGMCNRVCGNPLGFCLDDIHAPQVLESVELALGRFPRASAQKTHQDFGQARGREGASGRLDGGTNGGPLRRVANDHPQLVGHLRNPCFSPGAGDPGVPSAECPDGIPPTGDGKAGGEGRRGIRGGAGGRGPGA
jgi:ADP-heptose:LPS heptosyltransferase